MKRRDLERETSHERKVWAGMGSNHRKRELVDLQSTPFDHSGTYPKHASRLVRSGQVGNGKEERMQGENDGRGVELARLYTSFTLSTLPLARAAWYG